MGKVVNINDSAKGRRSRAKSGRPRPSKTALVLGGGGFTGGVYEIGALRALRDAGRQFEVALVGFDDFELADLLQPAVTVVAQDPQEIGHLAAERLFARLDGDDSPFHTDVVTTRLIVRGSGEIPPR